jgi:predicted small lipoprotein YifL
MKKSNTKKLFNAANLSFTKFGVLLVGLFLITLTACKKEPLGFPKSESNSSILKKGETTSSPVKKDPDLQPGG